MYFSELNKKEVGKKKLKIINNHQGKRQSSYIIWQLKMRTLAPEVDSLTLSAESNNPP